MNVQRAGQPGWEAELFRLLVENSTDYAVFVIDPEGRVLTWNRAAERVTS
jgi:PAS domain S-box-containing protein